MTLDRLFSGEKNGVFRWEGPEDARAGAEVEPERAADEAGWRYVLLDSWSAADKATFFECCAEAFDLPEWFGRNWDALDECLRGLDLDEPDGLLVVWQGWSVLAEGDPDAFDTALEVFRDAVVAWDFDEVRGAVLLIGQGPEADLPAL